MKYEIYSLKPIQLSSVKNFAALHPMFQLKEEKISKDFQKQIDAAKQIVVCGMGGSVLPLKALVDAAGLHRKISFLATVDGFFFDSFFEQHKEAVFCIVSKSGETLEVKDILAELLHRNLESQLLVVTDLQNGSLRQWAEKNKIPSCPIPANIGGRFTNFIAFHQLLLKHFGCDTTKLMDIAQKRCAQLKEEPSLLEELYQLLFTAQISGLVLWAYGSRLDGLALWIQQALAESLGKKTASGCRHGILPTVLKGPQDQHSVLQLLRDGPQNKLIWFLTPYGAKAIQKRQLPELCRGLEEKSSDQILEVLAQATFMSFRERVSNPEESQNLIRWQFSSDELLENVVEAIVTIQAFVEYAGQRLEIDAFNQPGVERGKELTKELLSTN